MIAAERALAMFAPLAAVWVAAAVRPPSERAVAAMILATAWNLLALSLVNAVALGAGWWRFGAEGAVVAGVPVDVLLGWALLWGALPAHAASRLPVPLTAAVLVWLDLAFMPIARPLVVLGRGWLLGEALAVALGLVPGLLLARWTSEGRRLAARAALQVVLAGGLMVAVPVALTGVWRQPAWLCGLAVQVVAVPMVLGVAAAREFATAGGGTPLPYDPPPRLVTGGPYAYVRNPMQVSIAAVYALLGALDGRFLLAAASAVAYGAGLAAWHEGLRLAERHGDDWAAYRRRVRPWLPRLRPAAVMPEAVVHVSSTCDLCRPLGWWIARRRPVRLRVLPAEAHPGRPRRMTYERADGLRAEGVAAFAHAAGHLHLGWALAGWVLLLPGIGWFAQVCADALGAGPRDLPASPPGGLGGLLERAPLPPRPAPGRLCLNRFIHASRLLVAGAGRSSAMASPVTGGTVPPVALDGRGLTGEAVARIAGGAAVTLDPRAVREAGDAWARAAQLTASGRVYGRSTGVGANRTVEVDPKDAATHGARLLRSHAGGAGTALPARQVRAMMAVRLNQLLAGGSGVRPAVVQALALALNAGVHPEIHEYGAVGTGDLSALAGLGLALAGELPWQGEGTPPPPVGLETGDALALMSSNALCLGQAALARQDLGRLLQASCAVTALSLLAVRGSAEAFAAPVHARRPHAGSIRAAAEIRRLIGAADRPAPPADRVQDPYALRCFPQVHGAALDACAALDDVLAVDLNAAAENPLISPDGPGGGPAAYHHGGFYAAHLALALDHLRPALLQTARLSAARLSALFEPAVTGLRPFLADDVPAGSGVLILEYSANAALAALWGEAGPATLGHAVLSRGVEEAASFATQSARQTLRAADAYRVVLGCELVAAVRALRQHHAVRPMGECDKDPVWQDLSVPAGRAFALADAALDPSMADRPLTADVAAATALLDRLADL
ncbi:hypothetical protein Mco01_44840 [Microbispora corallina]|uniref:Histidine ammonia-lyase n=1 Tax=Microbispora corallina TaxID=83302 RepID=A0ABQ4G350_9ACTN|nr:aromatic amino acid lyase [Microbispora corallina]GIH41484.1 hypothetical protein Mco01_44840 [Microbispora corallina]